MLETEIQLQMQMQIENRAISKTHYIIIDCIPGPTRPEDALKHILIDDEPEFEEDDALINDDNNNEILYKDFRLVSNSFGEWKFAVYKDKEQAFEAKLPKILDRLTNLFNSNIVRYAEWRPK